MHQPGNSCTSCNEVKAVSTDFITYIGTDGRDTYAQSKCNLEVVGVVNLW